MASTKESVVHTEKEKVHTKVVSFVWPLVVCLCLLLRGVLRSHWCVFSVALAVAAVVVDNRAIKASAEKAVEVRDISAMLS